VTQLFLAAVISRGSAARRSIAAYHPEGSNGERRARSRSPVPRSVGRRDGDILARRLVGGNSCSRPPRSPRSGVLVAQVAIDDAPADLARYVG